MKIIIGGKDRTSGLGPALKAEADARMAKPPHPVLPHQLSALSLCDAGNEAEFLDRWAGLIRRKSHVDTNKVEVARRPGGIGALTQKIRMLLWKVFRYQHNGVVGLQNQVNSQLTAAMEFQLDEIRRLQARVEELERRGGGSR